MHVITIWLFSVLHQCKNTLMSHDSMTHIFNIQLANHAALLKVRQN